MIKQADGDNLIYHYLQKQIIEKDDEFSRELTRRLIRDLSVWLPPELYLHVPVLLPYAVRDPTCRKGVNKKKEEWGSPDRKGFFRDDNSLIKSVPKGIPIKSSILKELDGHILGNGFTAAHIWGETRDYRTYSFVPNIVWLPRQIAKLTDRKGSFAQKYLQLISRKIYKRRENSTEMWGILKDPNINENIDVKKLNYFAPDSRWIERRQNMLQCGIRNIKETAEGRQAKGKLHCSRYLKGLKTMRKGYLTELLRWIEKF